MADWVRITRVEAPELDPPLGTIARLERAVIRWDPTCGCYIRWRKREVFLFGWQYELLTDLEAAVADTVGG